jgi:glycosyltransferase involved in cell wall biosynthesis
MDNYVNPKITVLMPVYNCELYIREAVDSILNQTYSDFEFLIIDDASTDETVAIIKTYNDSRIQLIQKSINTGLTNSLNHGLKIAKGKYIARMDGDDISLPERFAKQVAFLDANPDVVLCGTNFSIIGTEKVINLPEKNKDIKLALLKGNCIAHPSVMIRNCTLEQFAILYDSNTEPAEDYDLWVRLLEIGKLFNLQEELLNYRVHNTQVSQKREMEQIQSALESRFKLLKYLNYTFNDNEYDLLKKMMQRNVVVTFDEINGYFILKQKMVLANSNDFFDFNGFQKYLSELQNQNFQKYFVKRESFHPIIFFQYFSIRDKYGFKLKFKDELKIVVKSLIFFRRKE